MINIKSSSKKRKINKKLKNASKFNINNTFDELYAKSKKGENFNHLMQYITSSDNIYLALTNLKNNKGSKTPGVDGKNINYLLSLDNEELLRKVRKKFEYYQPKAIKRVEIPKPNGKTRPLGIPCILDRLVQQCILQVIEPICEARFSYTSYGFRPYKSTEHAIAKTYNYAQIYNLHYVVNVDIQGFFDNVNHKRLIRQMYNIGIHDQKLLAIIKSMLKAPIQLKNGDRINPQKGTPQGGILSPILSNIVLNDLDKWVESQWEDFPSRHDYTNYRNRNGKIYLEKANKGKMLSKNSKLKKMYIVRYADDFKIFTNSKDNANRIFIATKKWLNERLTLNINEEKSSITNLRKEKMEYLGFEIRVIKRHNKYVVKSNITPKAIERLDKKIDIFINQWYSTDSKEKRWEVLYNYNVMIIGFHNYYSLATRCTSDLRNISYIVFNKWKRKAKYSGFSKTCTNTNDAKGFLKTNYFKKYSKSSMIRYINNFPLIPLSYISFRIPHSCTNINRYSKEDREYIDNNLSYEIKSIEIPKIIEDNENVEYLINRHLKIINTHGICEITKKKLDKDEINCHHITPRYLNGNEKYDNLIIVSKDIHILLHLVDLAKIKEMVIKLNLDAYQMRKINKLRAVMNLEKVSKELVI